MSATGEDILAIAFCISLRPEASPVLRAAANEDILEFRARNCNTGEIVKESTHLLICQGIKREGLFVTLRDILTNIPVR